MAFGILEDHKLDHVPGTGLLSARGSQVTTADATGLKRGTGRSSNIVLMPQPSDDPNDPLNWPAWRKEACFWTLVIGQSVASANSHLASAAFVQLATEFHVSVDHVTSCFSANSAGRAIFIFLQNPLAIKYGHRIVYLLVTFLMFISCVWSALSTGLASISASRVFQGFGEATLQSLVAITIGQLYFVHERGTRTSIWTLSQVAGSTLGTIINSYVIQQLSWRFGFWFMSIACGICFIAVVLLVPETTYHHDSSPRRDSKTTTWNVAHGDDAAPSRKPTFFSQIKIYSGIFSEESMWKIFLRPFPFLLSPVTWFAIVCYLIPEVLFGLVTLCLSTIFTVSYGFNTAQIGLTHLAGLVGCAFAIIVAGPIGDWWIVWMSRRNRGIYEPEFRLVLMLSLLVGTCGYVGWAVGNDHHMPWIGAIACLAMLYFSSAAHGATTIPYLIDAHGSNSLHIISLTNFAKNALLYGSAFFANGIVLSTGIKRSLLVYGACQVVCWLMCIPMYVYGKRARSFIARHPRLFCGELPSPDSSQSGAVSEADSKS